MVGTISSGGRSIAVATEIHGDRRRPRRGSTCTRFDYRSRFEDRLIASSVDEDLVEEGRVGSRVPAATAQHHVSSPARIARAISRGPISFASLRATVSDFGWGS